MEPIHLTGSDAFYNVDYVAHTQRDFASKKALPQPYIPPSSYIKTETKVIRIVKIIFAIIVFPIGIYKTLQFIAGRILIASTRYRKEGPPIRDRRGHEHRSIDGERVHVAANLDTTPTGWKLKRITIQVNGRDIDGVIMVRRDTAHNGRWMVVSEGRQGYWERKVQDRGLQGLLEANQSNAIILNYAGVGRSVGPTTRANLVEGCKAAFAFVEEKLQATHVIGYGYSMGGGVMSEAMAKLPSPSNGVTRVALFDRTFCRLTKATARYASKGLGRVLGPVVRFVVSHLFKGLGWELRTSRACKRLTGRRVVLQTTSESIADILGVRVRIHRNDGIIHRNDTLAARLVQNPTQRDGIVVLGITENHNAPLGDAIVAMHTNGLLLT